MPENPTRMRDWIVVADEGKARVLAPPSNGAPLADIESMTFASARADEADLRRDAFGRRAGGDLRSGGNVTASAGADALDLEAGRFAERVAGWLATAEQAGRFDRLYLYAAPRMLGHLRKKLSAGTNARLVEQSDSDLAAFDARELTQRLYPDVDVRGPVR